MAVYLIVSPTVLASATETGVGPDAWAWEGCRPSVMDPEIVVMEMSGHTLASAQALAKGIRRTSW